VDDAIDLLGRGHGMESRLVSRGASGLLELAGLRFLAAERMGLAVLLVAGFVQTLTEFAALSFHLGQAASQALIVPPKGLDFLGQQSDASAQMQDLTVPFLTARTKGRPDSMRTSPSAVEEKQVGQ
jgi:hypothetical protein